jgi:hypothetical protein
MLVSSIDGNYLLFFAQFEDELKFGFSTFTS